MELSQLEFLSMIIANRTTHYLLMASRERSRSKTCYNFALFLLLQCFMTVRIVVIANLSSAIHMYMQSMLLHARLNVIPCSDQNTIDIRSSYPRPACQASNRYGVMGKTCYELVVIDCLKSCQFAGPAMRCCLCCVQTLRNVPSNRSHTHR